MLKIRLQGTTKDLKWFKKILEKDRRITVLSVSEPFANKGTNKLARQGKKVLLIDADAQGSLMASLGYTEPDKLEVTLVTIMEQIVNEDFPESDEGILHHNEGVYLLLANIEFSGIEVSLINILSRETVLKEYVNSVTESYDYILIDCMPSLEMVTINALACADFVLIPVQAAYLPLKA